MSDNNTEDPIVAWLKANGAEELTIARLRRAARENGFDTTEFLGELISHWQSATDAERQKFQRIAALRSKRAKGAAPE